MPEKAQSYLVPYNAGSDVVRSWGDPPYFQIGISARNSSRRVRGEGNYHSIEMLSNLHSEIGALLAKNAHAQAQR